MQYGAFLLTRPLSYFLTANLTLKQLYSVLMGIESRWFELGIQLEVPLPMLRSIEVNYRDSHRCLLELLECWLSNDRAASWTKLVGVLQEMSENLLAHRIYRVYVQGITASHERLIFSWSTKSTP